MQRKLPLFQERSREREMSHHRESARRSTWMSNWGALRCGRWPSVLRISTEVRPPRWSLRYVATVTGTDTSLAVCTITHGERTRPSTPRRSVLKTVRETNNEISGLMLNNVLLNSLTAAGTSAPTVSGANPLTHAS